MANRIKENIYLDTSVISAYFDSRAPERQQLTLEFWKSIVLFKSHISEIVLNEISRIPDDQLRQNVRKLISEGFTVLKVTPEAQQLAEIYVQEKLFPQKFMDDALHLALATTAGLDVIVSWNFAHFVKRKTRLLSSLINAREGYKQVDISAPPEL